MNKEIKAVSLVLIGFSGSVNAGDIPGYVCDNCVDYASAVREAAQYAPEASCNQQYDQASQCGSMAKNIVLGYFPGERIYPFRVSRDGTPPFAVHVEDLSLPSEKYANFLSAIELANTVNKSINSIQDQWNPETGRFISTNFGGVNARTSEELLTASNGSTIYCPTGTALEALTDDDIMDELIEQLKLKARGQLNTVQRTAPDTVVAEFQNNEEGAPGTDSLVFQVSALFDVRAVALKLSISHSTIFGRSAEEILGGMDITNECALARLAALPVTRPGSQIKINEVPVNTAAGFPAGPDGKFESAEYCTYDVYQSIKYQFSFRAPCVE